jgi:pyridoxamine 5'-phosphate oxidase family protein
MFTDAEYDYLKAHTLGRLASIGLNGSPEVHPVTFSVDSSTGFVEIGGPRLRDTHKYRNIRRDPRVSLIVDDQAPEPLGPDGTRSRGIEIRGTAELSERTPAIAATDTDIIRIRPALIDSWNLDGSGRHCRFVN